MYIKSNILLIKLIFICSFFIILCNKVKCDIVVEVVQDQTLKQQQIDFSKGNYIKIGDVVVKVISDGNNSCIKGNYLKQDFTNKITYNIDNNKKNNSKELKTNKQKTDEKKDKNVQLTKKNEQKKNNNTIFDKENYRMNEILEKQRKQNEELIKKVNNVNLIIDVE